MRKEGRIVCQVVVGAAKRQKFVVALAHGLGLRPVIQPMLLQVVLVVFQQFLVTAFGDTHQFYLRLERGLSVGEAFGNVLFHGTGSLHHLVNGAVAVFGQETLTECLGELHQHIALAVEVQVGIYRCFPHDARRTVIISPQVDVLRVWHSESFIGF